jgi:hypothetical protein
MVIDPTKPFDPKQTGVSQADQNNANRTNNIDNVGPNSRIQTHPVYENSWDRPRPIYPRPDAPVKTTYRGEETNNGAIMGVGKGPSYSQVTVTPTNTPEGQPNQLQAGQGHYQRIIDSKGVDHGYVMAYQPGSVAGNPMSTTGVAGAPNLTVGAANGIANGIAGQATQPPAGTSSGDHSSWGLVDSSKPATPASGGPVSGSSGPGAPAPNPGYQWKTIPTWKQGIKDLWNHKGADSHTLGTDVKNEIKGNVALGGAVAQDIGHAASIGGQWGLHHILQPMSNYLFNTNYGSNPPTPSTPAPANPSPVAAKLPPVNINPLTGKPYTPGELSSRSYLPQFKTNF